MIGKHISLLVIFMAGLLVMGVYGATSAVGMTAELSGEQVEKLVRRSYQYVAMYNVNNKAALDRTNPLSTGGWNRVFANTTLADHTMQTIARPNNDTLYVTATVDVTEEPMILEMPALDSSYASLMVTGYDHYVNIPMSTRLGDFSKPSRILFYTERTPGYAGEPVGGVDRIFEATGDFLSAVVRVMPHVNEPERSERILKAMGEFNLVPLSEYKGSTKSESRYVPWTSPARTERNLDALKDAVRFPEYGRTDFDIFEDNLLEVIQFVFNHTTFDPKDEIDQTLLALYHPLGVVPGRTYDSKAVAEIDGERFREVAERVASTELSKAADPAFVAKNVLGLFQPKGKMTLELLTFQSVLGPIGQPAVEAVYPQLATKDGAPMNALNDYELVMKPDQMPPATAFWSTTLYDTENGFFIPNDKKKYSVGENGGMKLDEDGGIRIVISAERPEDVPVENWLPVNRGDYDIDVIMRIYAPDLERFATWTPPVARKLK